VNPGRTPSQTIGPFFAVGLPWREGPFVVPEGTSGAVWIRGSVLDGAGEPVPDAMIETWQADPDGRFRGGGRPSAVPGFRGFGRAATDPGGQWFIHTVKPGSTTDPRGTIQAPHLAMLVFARGLLKHAVTRLYFPDETAANAGDPVLTSVTDPAARATLLAEPTDEGYRFDIRLQGHGETVFFEL